LEHSTAIAFRLFTSTSLPEFCNANFSNLVVDFFSAFHGHEAVISSLVGSDAGLLNARDSSGSTPLHEAVKSGNLDAAECIVRLGADCSLADNIGQTILHIAALTGNVEAVEYILERDLIRVNHEASFGITPLMVARRSNHRDIIDILIKKGATG